MKRLTSVVWTCEKKTGSVSTLPAEALATLVPGKIHSVIEEPSPGS